MKKTTLILIVTVCAVLAQEAFAGPKRSLPDAATTSLWLTGSIAGLAFLRKFWKR